MSTTLRKGTNNDDNDKGSGIERGEIKRKRKYYHTSGYKHEEIQIIMLSRHVHAYCYRNVSTHKHMCLYIHVHMHVHM